MRRKDKEEIKRVKEGKKEGGGKRSVTLGAYNLLAMQYFLPVSSFASLSLLLVA